MDIVADVAKRDTGETAIIIAASQGHVRIVKRLLKWAEKAHKNKHRSSWVKKNGVTDLDIKDGDDELTAGERLNIEKQANDGTNVLMAVCAIPNADPKELLDVLDRLSKLMTTHIKSTELRKLGDHAQHKHAQISEGNGGANGGANGEAEPTKKEKAKNVSPIVVKQLKHQFANLQNKYGDTALDLAVRRNDIDLAMGCVR